MADEQNPFGQAKKDDAQQPAQPVQPASPASQEANAADLLSLWGSGTAPTPRPAPQPIANTQQPAATLQPSPPLPPVAKPAAPVAPVRPAVVPPQATTPVRPVPVVPVTPAAKPQAPTSTATPPPRAKPVEPPKPSITPAPVRPSAPRPTPPPTQLPWEQDVAASAPDQFDAASPRPTPPPPSPIFSPDSAREKPMEKKQSEEKEKPIESTPKKPVAKAKPEIEEVDDIEPPKEKKSISSKKDVFEGEVVSEPVKKTPPVVAKEASSEDEFVTPIEKDHSLEEDEGFGSQVNEFLRELNVSWGQIARILGCIVLLVVAIFGGLYAYRAYKNPSDKPTTEQPQETAVTSEQTGVVASQQVGEIRILPPEMVGDTGISATVSIGREFEGATDIAKYIMTFRRLQNAYGVNINDLLNKSTDRRGSLRGHLALLRKVYDEGVAEVQKIKDELATIKIQYDPQSKRQLEDDLNFFEQLNALNAKTSEDILADFIQVSQQVVSLRARFKALQRIQSFYEQGLPKLAVRIRDIELNEEPLVAGIKVFDVKGSDLQLIVPVVTDVPEVGSLQTPSYPLIPTDVPSYQNTAGKDFIKEPGGGFNDYLKVPPPAASAPVVKPIKQ